MRIVAGKLRGLNLLEFDAGNIRPTTDRVRENIFNKIQFGVSGSSVLDLFCGTGAVSLEFLSRGAAKVISVDNNSSSINLIKQNFAKAKLTPNLLKSDFKSALKQLVNTKFDYIFLDPPYDTTFGEDAIEIIAKNNMLDSDGMVIFEHLVGKKFGIPESLEVVDTKKYGTIEVTFIKGKCND